MVRSKDKKDSIPPAQIPPVKQSFKPNMDKKKPQNTKPKKQQ